MTDVTAILVAAIAFIFAMLFVFVVPALKGKMTPEQLEQVDFWLTTFCNAAEEAKRNGILADGKEQFEYVKQRMEEKGFTFDLETITALINGKVYDLFHAFEPVKNVGGIGGTE